MKTGRGKPPSIRIVTSPTASPTPPGCKPGYSRRLAADAPLSLQRCDTPAASTSGLTGIPRPRVPYMSPTARAMRHVHPRSTVRRTPFSPQPIASNLLEKTNSRSNSPSRSRVRSPSRVRYILDKVHHVQRCRSSRAVNEDYHTVREPRPCTPCSQRDDNPRFRQVVSRSNTHPENPSSLDTVQ